MYSFPNFEPVHCSMSSSNCCFSTCCYRFLRNHVRWSGIPISLRIFHSLFVIPTVKGFCIVNEAEVDVFLKFPCFFYDPGYYAKSFQSCPTFCDPMDCNLPGSSVHGTLKAWLLAWFAISFSRGSSWFRDQASISYISCISRRVLYH